MLYWAAVFFICALIFAALAFCGIATAGVVGAAKVLFFMCVVAFVVSLLMGLYGRSEPF